LGTPIPRFSALSLIYVASAMVLMGLATTDPNHPKRVLFVVALALCLPGLVPALPVLYVAVALAWSVTNADAGGVTWPVTAAYVLAAALAATCNVWLIGRLRRTLRHA
jgi:hypothetical protein